jgi:hypothetical protein
VVHELGALTLGALYAVTVCPFEILPPHGRGHDVEAQTLPFHRDPFAQTELPFTVARRVPPDVPS